MSLQFSANISWLFQEAGDLPARFQAARAAGFRAVEGGDVFSFDAGELAAAREAAGVEHVLINGHGGSREGDKGVAALPGREQDFRDSLDLSIKYAKALKCPSIHILAGKHPTHWSDAGMGEVLVDNLHYASDRLAAEGLEGLLEPIGERVIKNYYLDHPEKVMSYIKKVDRPNIRMLLDVFHLQLSEGNLTATIDKYLPKSGHIQVAQAPGRHELDYPGEIDFKYILNEVASLNYDGWIGLEYAPSTGNTVESLKWKEKWGF